MKRNNWYGEPAVPNRNNRNDNQTLWRWAKKWNGQMGWVR